MSQALRRREVGELGERIAAEFLERRGFKVLDRNYRRPWGKIDLIVEKGRQVRFVEVKAVTLPDGEISRENSPIPEELVDSRKLQKVARTAILYMEEAKDTREFQIDVVGVILDTKTRTARCRHFEQVLEGGS